MSNIDPLIKAEAASKMRMAISSQKTRMSQHLDDNPSDIDHQLESAQAEHTFAIDQLARAYPGYVSKGVGCFSLETIQCRKPQAALNNPGILE